MKSYPLLLLEIGKSVLWNTGKIDFWVFQNNPKDLHPSYNIDLDLWDCFVL